MPEGGGRGGQRKMIKQELVSSWYTKEGVWFGGITLPMTGNSTVP